MRPHVAAGRASAPRRRAAFPLAIAVLAAFVLAAPLAPSARAQDSSATTPEQARIPDPVGFVNDPAGVLDETTHAKLEAFLDQVQRKASAQFAVLIVKTTAPMTPTEYKTAVFDRWKIGKQGEDNGLLMLVALDEHEVRFETGYGLEGALPDAVESRVVRNEMAPRFRAGDVPGGVVAGVLACASRIAHEKGVTLEWNGETLRYDGGGGNSRGTPGWLLALIVFFVVMSFVSRASRYASRGGWRGGGWGGGWGGGFGGGFGGGGFGGGGGGGSFGGFGGGSSGGGGGGGSW